MNTHTPGPWGIYDDGPDGSDVILAHVDGENYDIAYISNDASEGRPEGERKANARLIAAAPALLEALKACERALECRDTEAEEYAAKEARRVLRLAEGRP